MKKELFLFVGTGFALFSMFFGSGNLVFPLAVGVESGGHFVYASLGVLISCVIFPLLGMLGMMLFKGDLAAFFRPFGKRGTFLFSLAALALMGPFGVLARCLTVIHGAIGLLFPAVSLWMTSGMLCVLIYFLARNRSRIVSIVGSYLTPFLLVSIAAIVFFGVTEGSLHEPVADEGMNAFTNGFFTGYQTMDLVASFFFAGFVLSQMSDTSHFLKSAFVGASLLYLVYFALVLLGWLYAPILQETEPQEMFGKVAIAALGSYGAPFVFLAVVLACLTTAIALASLFADFFQKEVCREKLSLRSSLLCTLVTAFCVSNLEFSGIAAFLKPILETIYPALIVFTVANIAGVQKYFGYRYEK